MKYIDKINEMTKYQDRLLTFLDIMDFWMEKLEQGKSIVPYCLNHGFYRVAIYGYGILGKHVFGQLNNSEVDVVCIIDRREEGKWVGNIKIIKKEDFDGMVDAVIVTPLKTFEEIKEQIQKDKDIPVVAFEELLSYMQEVG